MMMNKAIKVILVDDHAVVRAGFRMLLAASDGIEVVAEAERGEAVCQLYQQWQPDVVVMDLSMPGIGGLETIRRVISRHQDAKVLVFSVHDEQVYVHHAMSAGAQGYITKNSAPAILVDAIHALAAGGTYIEQGLLKSLPQYDQQIDYQTIIATLSPREFDVLRLLAKGLTVQKIAEELCLGQKTVANYGTQIKSKLQVSNLAELAHMAVLAGVVKS